MRGWDELVYAAVADAPLVPCYWALPLVGLKLLRDQSPFKSWAPWYDDSALQSLLFEPTQSAVLQQLQLHAPAGGRMLDVGCGTGRLLQAAAQRYSPLVGVDPCLQMLDAARARDTSAGAGHSPSFVCAMAEGMPFAAGTFDVVTSTMSLRHWDNLAQGLGELARVLSAAGTLVIADAEIHVARAVQRSGNSSPTPRRHRRVRRPVGQLRLLIDQCGLEVVDDQKAPVRGPVPGVQVLTARPSR